MSRRAFFVGLPRGNGADAALARSCSDSSCRAALLDSDSTYNFAASVAGPRRSVNARTVIVNVNGPLRTSS